MQRGSGPHHHTFVVALANTVSSKLGSKPPVLDIVAARSPLRLHGHAAPK